MLEEDSDAWQPLTLQQLQGMPPWQQKLLQLLSATPLRFFSSIGQWVAHFEYFDLKCHPRLTRPFVLIGWALPLAFAALVWPTLLVAGGGEAWVNGWLMPWLVFHAWLSLITLVHHTAPHIPWVEEVRVCGCVWGFERGWGWSTWVCQEEGTVWGQEGGSPAWSCIDAGACIG
jgi:fatty acid desaturase